MAGLFEGIAPPNIDTTRTTAQQAPQYLTDYLTNLAKAGTSALGTTAADGTFTPKTGEDLIASRPDYLANLQAGVDPATGQAYQAGALPGLADLGAYKGTLDKASTMAQQAGMPIGITGYNEDGSPIFSDTLKALYDPFQEQVINKMQEQSDINLQRSVLPGLKALGISSGQFGGSRTGALGGQALADIAANLQAQQTGARSAGFKTALDAALRQQGQQAQAAGVLGNIGGTEATAARGAVGTLADIGGQALAYDQSKIEAPLTRAANVAQIMRGYNYPTTTTETYKGPGTVYGPSVFSQIAGLGSLIGAAFPQGGGGFGNILKDIISGSATQFPEIAYPQAPIIDRSTTLPTGGGFLGEYESSGGSGEYDPFSP